MAYQQGDIERAFRNMDDAVRAGADWPAHIANWINLAFSSGRAAQAWPLLDKWYRENSDFPEVYVVKAELFIREKDFEKALAETRKGLAIAPWNTRLMFLEARALRELGRAAEALAALEKLLGIKPGMENAAALRVECLAAMKRFRDAYAAIEALKKEYPANERKYDELLRKVRGAESLSR